MRRIAVLDAPSNLGLRPPTATSVPGCAKAPGALRDQGLLARLGARDAGCLTPPRYDPGDWRPGDGVCHADLIAVYSLRLADRIGEIIEAGEFPLVLGGDCSVLLGSAVAMHRRGPALGGRIGLVFVDGHSDFRHPGNASYVGAAAGEDLALVTGRGQANLAGLEGRRPYFRDVDVVVLGIRAQDDYRLDLQAAGIPFRAVPALRAEGAARTAQWARDQLDECAGFWVHVDVDVLDPAVMPCVDAPDPGGIAYSELELLLAGLVSTPRCLGLELTVFDPDYDPDGSYAAEVVATVASGLAPLRAAGAPTVSSGSGAAGTRSGRAAKATDPSLPSGSGSDPASKSESVSALETRSGRGDHHDDDRLDDRLDDAEDDDFDDDIRDVGFDGADDDSDDVDDRDDIDDRDDLDDLHGLRDLDDLEEGRGRDEYDRAERLDGDEDDGLGWGTGERVARVPTQPVDSPPIFNEPASDRSLTPPAAADG
jgi:arginase